MARGKGKTKGPVVLGIETSCDDTAVGIVAGQAILANRVYSQHREHRPFGGVVPEVAARSHVDHLDRLLAAALKDAKLKLADIDAIAATAGPGLIGGLMVGLVVGKALALASGKPFLAVNHLEGHALSPRLVAAVPFPYLLLLISGGHCQLLAVTGVGKYRRLGTTIDDAAGEAFDKGAKLLGLSLPGGPMLEEAARKGRADAFAFPRPMQGRAGCDFSFSGLKTALLRETKRHAKLTPKLVGDLAASYQAAIADCLIDRARNAMAAFAKTAKGKAKPVFVLAGGVAANKIIRQRFEALCREKGFRYFAPPPGLCTDNGAVIAWAGLERFRLGGRDALDAPARARWPLDATSRPKIGFGRKGPKA